MASRPMRVEWEVFCDEGYYQMWAVRPVGDKDFCSPRLFHFATKKEADTCKLLFEASYHASPTHHTPPKRQTNDLHRIHPVLARKGGR